MCRFALPTIATAALLTLAGCGTPSQTVPMTLSPVDALQIRGWVPAMLKASVAVAPVNGGAETGRWWGSKVSAVALQQALEESLFAVGMHPLAPDPEPRYELQAELLALEQPLVPVRGATVGVAVRYTLVDRIAGKVVYQRRVANAEEARFSESMLSPSERLRIANERALRANINRLLRELVTLAP
ncbi:hypothetical protein [Roseateles sp. BYS96W]|uniref:ABC-type transport auxiliary lipoprotein component domain-containing protein n=1 Tax=Pelomonas nitida TaxID=3299027 RepID=A0ABW7G8G4_9BURK